MDSNYIKQQILESLQKNLPSLAVSISKLVSYLQNVIKNGYQKDKETMNNIIDELQNAMQVLEAIVDDKHMEACQGDDNIRDLYINSMKSVAHGLKDMILWLTNDTEPEEKLTSSVNQLFLASQQITELVGKLTNV
jgi:ElaB/YqjD/DUF883 family membrane-anchored ribosome-binding protein